mmetsp:Transcript_76382/g.212183  ORF Transcript_76382/g.212183 Transcript_76382/m.212183 type:complete len:249 (-) Transcript_76382:71-817(-)
MAEGQPSWWRFWGQVSELLPGRGLVTYERSGKQAPRLVEEAELLKHAAPPERSAAYWSEPRTSVFAIGTLSAICLGPLHLADTFCHGGFFRVALWFVWAAVAVVAASSAYIIFGGAGEIRRSAANSHPIPDVVAERLRRHKSMDGLANVEGPSGSETHGSFCVRCLLWRPPDGYRGTRLVVHHHCRTCQRCFACFDHHCDFFGRCIVSANMPCKWLVIVMGWIGVIITAITWLANMPQCASGVVHPAG